MSKEHPTPWTFHAVDACEDQPILDANGNEVLVRDSGVYPPDLDTCREIVDAVNDRAQLESLWARKQIHDPTGSEWHANGKLLYTKDNDFIGEMEHSDDARFVCDAVNNAPLFDILQEDHKELLKDVGRLRAELADKTRNYEDVIACHQRTEEYLRDLVKRLVTIRETLVWRNDEKTGLLYYDRVIDEVWARKTIEEAKEILKEDKE